ncbi:secondary thiamine-phosphate synthase enzyme YjbQ [Entomobacter blattae]|nr:secondary thiamine-phosphate synthase enzyme YjbQ [Entomobacter blattae]
MKQSFHHLILFSQGKSLLPFTQKISEWITSTSIQNGLLTLWCRHTSASLTVQENVDPTVRKDILAFFDRIVPEGNHYAHSLEGLDDMPAHLCTMLTNTHLSIPIENGKMVLGTWQGIYLFEHRRHSHEREIVLHLMGE